MAQSDATPDAINGLNVKQRKALAALVEGQTMQEAAAAAGVSYVTLWRWLKLPLFYGELRAAERAKLADIIRALSATNRDAMATLIAVKDDPETPAAVRVRAASDLLSKYAQMRALGLSAETLEDLAERLARLEEAWANRRR